jgi:DHA1 family bicyclomycin/chloramphenicol resistance-like MFS transporter
MARSDPAPPVQLSKDEAPIGFAEFVALTAALMSLTALGIDSMLPALPAIGEALGVATENTRQYVVTAFVAGFGVAQLIQGPLADRFGRRRLLIVTLSLYVVANVLCAVSGSFALLLVARVFGGATVAACRTAVVAIVRDCYSGRAMARVMSIAFMVFMIVPVLAPTFGTLVLQFGDWRAIFWTIAAVTALVLAWFASRLPETLHPEDRQPLSLRRIAGGWRTALTDRWSLGYALASGVMLGALYGYLNSVQQIMADVFGKPQLLALIFATTSILMAIANLLNARLVMRLGTQLISHGALIGLIASAGLHLAFSLAGAETLALFAVLQAITMACFGLASSNFSAMAMENMGHIAGTASSVQGFLSVVVGTVLGVVIGQAFDGTTAPLEAGFVGCGLVALAIVLVTERGRLFAR